MAKQEFPTGYASPWIQGYAAASAQAKPGQTVKDVFRDWYQILGQPYTDIQAVQAEDITASAAKKSAPSSAYTAPTGTPASSIGGDGTVANGSNNTNNTGTSPTPTAYTSAAAGIPSGSAGDAAQRAIQEAGTVYGMDAPPVTVPAGIGRGNPALADIAKAAIASGESEKASLAAQSRKAQGALETYTQGAFEYQSAIDDAIARSAGAQSTASAAFAKTIGVAEKYAGLAQQRTVDGLRTLDEIAKGITEKLQFGRAYDMEVAVQSTVGGLNDMDRDILNKYGADSDEYRQFRMAKGNTLASVLSSTQASYAKLTAELETSIFQGKADFLKQASVAESFERQKVTDTYGAMATADAAYALDAATFRVQQEMTKLAGWEDLANWQISTPVFQVDSMGTVNFLAQLAMGEWQQITAAQASKDAADAAKSAGKSAGMGSALGGIGGAIAMAMIMCDEELKDGIDPIAEACDKVCQVSGFTYHYTFRPSDKRAGIMAQDLEKVLPEGVETHNGIKFVRLDAVAGLLMSAVGELSERVKELEKKSNG